MKQAWRGSGRPSVSGAPPNVNRPTLAPGLVTLDLILASTSPYRRALIERLGVPFRCVAPSLDEEAEKDRLGPMAPADLAMRLAVAKARSVAAIEPAAVVIGSDQLVALDGQILGKPGSAERAVDQLARLSGRTHDLITALTVIHAGQTREHLDVARLSMRSLIDEEIRRYVDADRPLDCAGSYKLESKGIALFDSIESADQTAITGLPLIALVTLLRPLGFVIP